MPGGPVGGGAPSGCARPHLLTCAAVLCLVSQSCPILCDPMDCSPQSSSVHGDSPGKNTGVGCHALLQGIFLTQGLNPGLPHCRWILYHLSHQGRVNNTILCLRERVSINKALETPRMMPGTWDLLSNCCYYPWLSGRFSHLPDVGEGMEQLSK